MWGSFSEALRNFENAFVQIEASMDGITGGCKNMMWESMTKAMVFSIVGAAIVMLKWDQSFCKYFAGSNAGCKGE